MQYYPCCERVEKKTPDPQVRLSVPELRHLLTALLWRGWHGIEHLLHWPLAKTSSIPRHDMPLSKAGSNSVFLLSTTVVLSSRIKSTSKSVCRILITPLPAISRGSPKTRTSFRGKPLASRSRTASSTEPGFSNKPTAVFAISASINLICSTGFVARSSNVCSIALIRDVATAPRSFFLHLEGHKFSVRCRCRTS